MSEDTPKKRRIPPICQSIAARNGFSLSSLIEGYSLQACERNSLINGHLKKVTLVAKLLAWRLPSWVEREDLEHAGIVAMIEASERWDALKGEFWPFVYQAVRGAMLDWLSKNRRETFHVELSAVRVFATDPTENLSRELDIARAMKKLTVQERRVFTALRQGHRPHQIAGMLRITKGAVTRFRQNAERKLRKELVA